MQVRRATRVLVLFVTTLASLAALGSEPQAYAAAVQPPAPVSAMNGFDLAQLQGDALNYQLGLLQTSGVTTVREDAIWAEAEPNPPGPSGPVYDFGWMDGWVYALASHHLTWLPIVDYSTPWAASIPGDWRSPPADDNQYAAYAQALASRYGANGSFWKTYPQLPYEPVQMFEIWNEEDGTYFWDTGVDPGTYGRLYLAARSQIRAVDPTAQVIVGGLAHIPSQFVTAMFQAVPSLRGNVDGFGLHPYAADAAGAEAVIRSFRQTLDSLGETMVPIDLTEFGWEMGGSESWRAQMMDTLATSLGNSDCGLGVVAPFEWVDEGAAPAVDYGLASATGIRPSGLAWFSGLQMAASGQISTICAGSATGNKIAQPPATDHRASSGSTPDRQVVSSDRPLGRLVTAVHFATCRPLGHFAREHSHHRRRRRSRSHKPRYKSRASNRSRLSAGCAERDHMGGIRHPKTRPALF